MNVFELKQGLTDLYLINTQIGESDIMFLLPFISKQEKTKYQQYKNTSAALNYLTARFTLRNLLSKYLNQKASEIKIELSEHGKPFLAAVNNFHFNISHSSNLLLIGFAPQKVGVDLEQLNRKIDFEAIIKRFFSTYEQQKWQTIEACNKAASFCRAWTRKEAYLKALGIGLGEIANCNISFAKGINEGIVSSAESSKKNPAWSFYNFEPSKDFLACAATETKDTLFRLTKLNLLDLIFEAKNHQSQLEDNSR